MKSPMSEQIAKQILLEIRRMGVEKMYENDCTSVLAERLGAKKQVRYPEPNWFCDLVIHGSTGNDIWIEIKFAWAYAKDIAPAQHNWAFRKHLIADPSESALIDVTKKLKSLLNYPRVAYIGFLLVVFDSKPIPIPDKDIEEFETMAGLQEAPWLKYEEPRWINPRNPECNIMAFYWQRPTTNI